MSPSPAATRDGGLRVVSFNLHAGRDATGAPAFDRQIDLLRDLSPDLLAIQEADRNWPRSAGVDHCRELAAALDMQALLAATPPVHTSWALPTHPPVLEDIAIIVDDNVTGEQIESVIRQGGGKLLAGVRLFDIYYGEQIGAGKKSLAYSLTYQAEDRTLTDKDAAKIRNKIVKNLERVLNAQLRSE